MSKDVKHSKGGKQKRSNMKYLVKQVSRGTGIDNRHDLVVRNWSPRKVVDLYLSVRHFFDFSFLSIDKMRRYDLLQVRMLDRCDPTLFLNPIYDIHKHVVNVVL